jgi:cob(I)alamin adenosyltransferase
LKEFILPGGARPAAQCHVARAVCRRAERRLVAMARTDTVSPAALKYLNRLSDLLFVIARSVNRALGKPDVLWQPKD